MVSDFEIPATYSSSSAYPACFARILHERTRCRGARPLGPQRRIIVTVTLRVADEPPDRPEWLRETIRLLVESTTDERAHLLAIVDSAPEAELSAGSDDDWGLGQVAAHALIVERGVTLIGLRLATGAEPGPTGQPRPAASATTRTGIAGLAARAAAMCDRLRADFPGEPDAARTARHPYFGDLNCFGWLLMLPIHYKGHLAALRAGRPSAL